MSILDKKTELLVEENKILRKQLSKNEKTHLQDIEDFRNQLTSHL